MDHFSLEELYTNFCKNVKAGYFVMELNQNGVHKLYLGDRALLVLDVDKSLSPEECFKFVASHIEDVDKKLVVKSIETVLMQNNAEFTFTYSIPGKEKQTMRCNGARVQSKTPGVKIEGYVQDVTHTVFIQRMNQRYQDELYDKFYSLPFIGYLKDVTSGVYLTATQSYLDLVGKKRNEIVGKTDYEIFDPEKAKMNSQEDHYALCIDRPLVQSETIIDCDGNKRFLETYKTKFIDSLGRDVIFVMAIDFTEVKMLLEQKQKIANKGKEEQEAAIKSKTRFLRNISQDIKLPVDSIVCTVDRALRHLDEKDIVQDSLEKIKTSSNSLVKLASNLSELISYRYGKVTFDLTPYPLSDFIKEIVDEFEPEIKAKKLAIRYDFNGFRNKYAAFDKDKIGTIFRNLISNAVKYSRKGGTIYLRGKQFAGNVHDCSKFIVDIQDTGIGISQEFLNNIFGAFERERSESESGVNGSGLGLALVKTIVDSMKGDIKINSKINEGTTVEVTLNLKRSSKEEYEESTGREVDIDYIRSLVKGKRFLLVEDDEVTREVTEDLLKEIGFEVDTASNGAVATNIVSRKGMENFALIMMNAHMPVMDGFEASDELKGMFPDCKTPIICVSTNDLFGTSEGAYKNIDYYLTKPITFEKISELVLKFLK